MEEREREEDLELKVKTDELERGRLKRCHSLTGTKKMLMNKCLECGNFLTNFQINFQI